MLSDAHGSTRRKCLDFRLSFEYISQILDRDMSVLLEEEISDSNN